MPRGGRRGLRDVSRGGLDGLERKLALPQTMAERMRGSSLRHFVPVCPRPSRSHRAEFRMPFLPCFAAVLRAHWPARPAPSSRRRSAGMRYCASFQVIVSEPGAAAQDVHSDVQMHRDISSVLDVRPARFSTMCFRSAPNGVCLDERMGPTRFWPDTHAPRCFRGGSGTLAHQRSRWPQI